MVLTVAGYAANSGPAETVPAQIGRRTAVIEFLMSADAKPTSIKVISTESHTLSDFAVQLLMMGQIKPDSNGVTRIGQDSYRAAVSLPIPNDEAPLPPDTTPPVPRIRPVPPYPDQLRQQNITGGVVLRLTINEKAGLEKVELVSASHPEFGAVALTAVERWVFGKPATKEGKPISTTMLQLLTFEFEGGKFAAIPWQIPPEPALPRYWVKTSPPAPDRAKAN